MSMSPSRSSSESKPKSMTKAKTQHQQQQRRGSTTSMSSRSRSAAVADTTARAESDTETTKPAAHVSGLKAVTKKQEKIVSVPLLTKKKMAMNDNTNNKVSRSTTNATKRTRTLTRSSVTEESLTQESAVAADSVDERSEQNFKPNKKQKRDDSLATSTTATISTPAKREYKETKNQNEVAVNLPATAAKANAKTKTTNTNKKTSGNTSTTKRINNKTTTGDDDVSFSKPSIKVKSKSKLKPNTDNDSHRGRTNNNISDEKDNGEDCVDAKIQNRTDDDTASTVDSKEKSMSNADTTNVSKMGNNANDIAFKKSKNVPKSKAVTKTTSKTEKKVKSEKNDNENVKVMEETKSVTKSKTEFKVATNISLKSDDIADVTMSTSSKLKAKSKRKEITSAVVAPKNEDKIINPSARKEKESDKIHSTAIANINDVAAKKKTKTIDDKDKIEKKIGTKKNKLAENLNENTTQHQHTSDTVAATLAELSSLPTGNDTVGVDTVSVALPKVDKKNAKSANDRPAKGDEHPMGANLEIAHDATQPVSPKSIATTISGDLLQADVKNKVSNDILTSTKEKAVGTIGSSATVKLGKKKSKKHEVGKPSRPLSAYNLFFKDTRLVLLEEQHNKAAAAAVATLSKTASEIMDEEAAKVSAAADQPPVRKFRALEEMVKEIGKRWKELEPDKKAKYITIAEVETKRYKEQMLQYRKDQKAAIAIAKAELKKEMALANKILKKNPKKHVQPEEAHGALNFTSDTVPLPKVPTGGTVKNSDFSKYEPERTGPTAAMSDEVTKNRATATDSKSATIPAATAMSANKNVGGTSGKSGATDDSNVASRLNLPQFQTVAGQMNNFRANMVQGGMLSQASDHQYLQFQLQQQQRIMMEQREFQELMMKRRLQDQLALLHRQQYLNSGRGLNDTSSMLDSSGSFNHQFANHGIVSGEIDVSTLSDAELHLLVERRRLQQSLSYEQSLLADNLLMNNNSQQGESNMAGMGTTGRPSSDVMLGAERNVDSGTDMQRLLLNQKMHQLQSNSVQGLNQQEQGNDVIGRSDNRLSSSSETDFAMNNQQHQELQLQQELQLRRSLMMATSHQLYSSGGGLGGGTTPTPHGNSTTGTMNPPSAAPGASNANTEFSPYMASNGGTRGGDDQDFRRPSIVSLSTDEGTGNMMNAYNNSNHNDAIRRILLAQQQHQQQQDFLRKQQLMEMYSPNPVKYPGSNF